MFNFLRRRGAAVRRSAENSSYFDFQEDRLVHDNRLKLNALEALKEPATDGFVVQVADEETAEVLQREYFSALDTEK